MGMAIALALTGAAMAQDESRDDQTRKDQPQQRNNPSRLDNPQQRNDRSRQDEASQNQPAGTSAEQARPDPDARPEKGTTGTSAEYSAELTKMRALQRQREDAMSRGGPEEIRPNVTAGHGTGATRHGGTAVPVARLERFRDYIFEGER